MNKSNKIRNNGDRNRIEIDESTKGNWSLIASGDDNEVLIAAGCELDGARLIVKGSHNRIVFGQNIIFEGKATAEHGGALEVGDRSTLNNSNLVAYRRRLSIGADCMFAADVEVRTTDTHALYMIETGARINDDADVTVGDYVWLGKYVAVMKGAKIGVGASVALASVVTSELPPFSVSAGAPSRVVREGICWTRHIRKGVLAEDPIAMGYINASRISQ